MKVARISILCVLWPFLAGCAALELGHLQFEGADASAFCTKGGPGGTSGIGPGGIVTGAKVRDGFVGVVMVMSDCSIVIQATQPNPRGMLIAP